MSWIAVYETNLRQAAEVLAEAERRLHEEYLLIVASGVNTFQAQKMADVAYLATVRRAQAEYEIALSRLRREELNDTDGGTD